MPGRSEVWFDGRKLCARMPALLLIGNEMEPMWRQEDASVEGSIVCINPWRAGWTVVRVGSGWGRRRGAHYYFVDFAKKAVVRLKRSPTKNVHTQDWMDCVHVPTADKYVCFEWRDGRLVRGPTKIV